jgi:hypothetical protein
MRVERSIDCARKTPQVSDFLSGRQSDARGKFYQQIEIFSCKAGPLSITAKPGSTSALVDAKIAVAPALR